METVVTRIENTNELVAFDELEARIAEYKVKNENLVFNYADPKGEKDARSHIFSLRKVKSHIASIHKELKAEVLAKGKAVDAKKNKLTADVDEMIDFHLTPIKEIEARREAELKAKAEEERLEKERIEKEKAEKARLAEIERKRVADQKHRQNVEDEIEAVIKRLTGSDKAANVIVGALIHNAIPHLTINY